MLKKTVQYFDIVEKNGGFDTDEKEADLKFVYTLPAVRLYEQRTGRQFFSEYNQAIVAFTGYVSNISGNFEDMTDEEQLNLMPMLSDGRINGFMLDFVPCLYAEIHDGRFVQNEETVSNAESAMWFMDLINLQFFAEVFKEISANQSKAPVNKSNRSKKA